jgi:hypothetical protein
MLGPSGNPKTDNLVEIIKYLQTREGVHLKVEAAAIAKAADCKRPASCLPVHVTIMQR